MRKVSIFYNRNNQAVRLPKDFEFPGATELAIEKHGDVVTLRPVRPDWRSFFESPPPGAPTSSRATALISSTRIALAG